MSEADKIEVIISKRDWKNLQSGYLPTVEPGVKVLKIFSSGILHYMFGDKPEEEIVRVEVSKVE